MLGEQEQAVLAALDGEAEAMLDRTVRWAEIASGSGDLGGLARMADALAEAFAPLGGEQQLVEGEPSVAVLATGETAETRHGCHYRQIIRPHAPVRVLLTGHMDTVYGPRDPFKQVRWDPDGTLVGPGVADMKGGLSLMGAALGAVLGCPGAERLGFEILISSDEEVGSPSSAPLLAQAARNARFGLTYEPSTTPGGAFAAPRWGSGNFSAVLTGRSAHAGRNPEQGRNALLAAADLALRLERLIGPDLRVNPARIDGGGPNNVVPATAVLRFNVRPRFAAAQHEAEAAMAEAVAEVAAAREVAIELHGGFARPPKPQDSTQKQLFAVVREASADLGLAYATKESGGVCDGNNLAAHGLPVVDTMGVRGGAIHSPKEYLLVDSLVERAKLSALVLLRLAATP